MYDKQVICNSCGATAVVRATEGELYPPPGQSKSRVFLVIDCPNCGRREQLESPQQLIHNLAVSDFSISPDSRRSQQGHW
jgi:transcription elongation factor Elf1